MTCQKKSSTIKYKAEILEPFLVVSTFWVEVGDPYEPTLSQLYDLYEHNPLKEAVLSDVVLNFKPLRYICPSTFGFLTSRDCSRLLIEPNSPELRFIGEHDDSYKAIVTDPCLVLSRFSFEMGDRDSGMLLHEVAMSRYKAYRPSLFSYSDPIALSPDQLRYIELISFRDETFPFVLSTRRTDE